MHRDTVIGIVGVLILVAAMVGVFSYERGQAADLTGNDGFAIANLTGPSLSGNVAVGATDPQALNLNQTGMTNITFTLRWTASAGSDTLRLAIAPSNGTGIETGYTSEAEDDGEITLTVPVPNTGRSGTLGVGDWQVTVEFVSASTGLPAEPPIAPGGTRDTSVAYTVNTALQAWAANDA